MRADYEEPDFPSDEELAEKTKLFRELLIEERTKILRNANRTLTEEMTVDQEDLADEADLATADYHQGLAFRLRGRERQLLNKIDQALERIEDGEYFECNACGAFIGYKRLEARPVTTLCIRCKEKQERRERVYAN